MKQLSKKHIRLALVAFVLGVVWVSAMRFVLYSPTNTHYHANIRVVIDGQQETFDGITYYEEVTSCSAGESNPKARVHLHQPDNDVIHVHGEGATWGNLFENMGLVLGDSVVQTSSGIFTDNESGDLIFMLNGQRTRTIANSVIGDTDKLLVYFGNDSAESVQAEFDKIGANAAEFNEKDDPATCSGSESASFSDRFKHSIAL